MERGIRRFSLPEWLSLALAVGLWVGTLVRSAWVVAGEKEGWTFGEAFLEGLVLAFPFWLLLLVVLLWQAWPLGKVLRRPAGWSLLLCGGGVLPVLGLLLALVSSQRGEEVPFGFLPSPDGAWTAVVRSHLLWGRPVGEIWLSSSRGQERLLARYPARDLLLNDLTWSANGRYLGALFNRAEVRVWDVVARKEVGRWRLKDFGLPPSVATLQVRLSPDAQRLYFASMRPGKAGMAIWSVGVDGHQPQCHLYIVGPRVEKNLQWRVSATRLHLHVPDLSRVTIFAPQGVSYSVSSKLSSASPDWQEMALEALDRQDW